VLEALLKRVDGLEQRLKDEKKSYSLTHETSPVAREAAVNGITKPKRLHVYTANTEDESAVYSPIRSGIYMSAGTEADRPQSILTRRATKSPPL
jgi:hypothetical protein